MQLSKKMDNIIVSIIVGGGGAFAIILSLFVSDKGSYGILQRVALSLVGFMCILMAALWYPIPALLFRRSVRLANEVKVFEMFSKVLPENLECMMQKQYGEHSLTLFNYKLGCNDESILQDGKKQTFAYIHFKKIILPAIKLSDDFKRYLVEHSDLCIEILNDKVIMHRSFKEISDDQIVSFVKQAQEVTDLISQFR